MHGTIVKITYFVLLC